MSCKIGIRDDLVVLFSSDKPPLGMKWQTAVDIYFTCRRILERECKEEIIDGLTLINSGTHVVFEHNNVILMIVPHSHLMEVARGLYSCAKKIEELESADQICDDQALLLRSPLQIGLSDNKKIKEEALKRAEDIKTVFQPKLEFGLPKIVNHPPIKENRNG